MILDVTPLENAVARLEAALALYHSDLIDHSDLALHHPDLKDHLRSAVIQAFEFTYELSFKMMKRFLTLTSANPAAIDQFVFQDVVREAYRQDLIRSELPVWHEFRRNRGTTSHTYDDDKAQAVFESVPSFLEEARYLLNRLHARIESLDSPC